MKKMWMFLAATLFFTVSSHASTFIESQVGGDTTGAILITIQKYHDGVAWKRVVNINYETRDALDVVIRTGVVSLDYDTMTAGEKAYVDGIITKAITKAKNATSIP